jgi:hypothetical protein
MRIGKWTAVVALVAMLATTLAAPQLPLAYAGSKGRRNTAIALGAVTVYSLLKGKKKAALIGAAATAYAYKRYSNEKRRERERRETRERREARAWRWQRSCYQNDWRGYNNHYSKHRKHRRCR